MNDYNYQRKRVVLIRHGQSLGQTARQQGLDRKRDPSLLDCSLSPQGTNQAINLKDVLIRCLSDTETMDMKEISSGHQQQNQGFKIDRNEMQDISFDLVCVSPLTRAITTCVLGLGYLVENEQSTSASASSPTTFICHPSIAESGGSIPENIGRPIHKVIADVRNQIQYFPSSQQCLDRIDFGLVPSCWPDNESTERNKEQHSKSSAKQTQRRKHSPKKNRYNKQESSSTSSSSGIYTGSNKLQNFLQWLYQRPERNIAVVCHHNVILHLLQYKVTTVPNCTPIVCDFVRIDRNGDGGYVLEPIQNSTHAYCSEVG